MTRILLTGAAGFIGGHILSALRESGVEVVPVDLLVASAHEVQDRSPDILALDVRDGAAMESALAGVDAVCHQAAVVGAGVDSNDAPAFASHNDFGTAQLLAAMYRTGCQRLVLASSMVVYGDGQYRTAVGDLVDPVPRITADLDNGEFDPRAADGSPLQWDLVTEDAPLRPRSFYAASKVAQENYALAWTLATGGSATALRYHNVYGPHMPRDTPYSGVAAMFRSSLENGAPPTVYEDGQQMRDFIHVSDIAAANVAALRAALPGFDAFNVSSGQPIRIVDVAQRLAEISGGPSPLITGQYRPGDVRHIVASPAKAQEILGFRAEVAPAQGLAEFATAPLRAGSASTPPRV